MAEIQCGKSLAILLGAEGWWRVRWVTAGRKVELRVSTPVFQVRYLPLIKVKVSFQNRVSQDTGGSGGWWIKETQMSLQIVTELWKSPMELKCLGAFVFPHWACLDLQAFGCLWQSAHCFISFTFLPWVCPKLLPGLAPIEAAVPACWPSWVFPQEGKNKGREGKRRPGQRRKGRRVFRPADQWVVDVSAESCSPSLDQQLPLLVQCVWTLSSTCQWALPHAQAALNPKGYFG